MIRYLLWRMFSNDIPLDSRKWSPRLKVWWEDDKMKVGYYLFGKIRGTHDSRY